MTAEKRAALMTRAVKLALPLLHILLKRAEERREKRVLVALRRGVDLTAVIGARFVGLLSITWETCPIRSGGKVPVPSFTRTIGISKA